MRKKLNLWENFLNRDFTEKKQYILQDNDVCNQFNFVARGCLRMYKIDEKGFRFFHKILIGLFCKGINFINKKKSCF